MIYIPHHSMVYPVGDNVKQISEVTDCYLDAFKGITVEPQLHINLWCRGSSGAIMASAFAMKLQRSCSIVYVRKEHENSHTDKPNPSNKGYNIIIDDFVCSGNTVRKIMEHMKEKGYMPDLLIVCTGGKKFESEIPQIITNYVK